MEQRALLAFILSVGILVGYQYLFAPQPQVPPGQQQAGRLQPGLGSAPTGGDLSGAVIPPPVSPTAPVPALKLPPVEARGLLADPIHLTPGSVEQLVELSSDLVEAVFTSRGGRLRHYWLREFNKTNSGDSGLLDMVTAGSLLPLGAYWTDGEGQPRDDRNIVYELDVERLGADTAVVMRGQGPAGEEITKRVTLHGGSYVLDVELEVKAEGSRSTGLSWTQQLGEQANRFAGTEGPVGFIDGELEASAASGLEEPLIQLGQITWAGYASHYFMAAFFPPETTALRFVAAAGSGLGEVTLWEDGADSLAWSLFVGPKRLHLLEDVGHSLDTAIDLGWFSAIARPMLEALIFLERYVGNFGVAILLLTLGVRVLFYPVNKRQAHAMKAMQKVQPELKKIQEKYKDDRETLNREMMELYRRHKVNPLSGCLPMVVQIPVFLGLYNALMQAIELRHAPFIGWMTDLSQPDRLGSLAIPFVSPAGIPVMTLFMGASMVLQQRMTPSMGDPAQQKMMMLMPVVFTVMFVNFPSGLVLYWFTNNLLSIAQQYHTNRQRTQE
ncbi:MAG: membrane protein insertase YidC [Deltaproteobacteria bacterium]|nr:membrane protein insertase YidC [Deltaproteobacteria bacterium]